jgi:hypothetical protein
MFLFCSADVPLLLVCIVMPSKSLLLINIRKHAFELCHQCNVPETESGRLNVECKILYCNKKKHKIRHRLNFSNNLQPIFRCQTP